jgi:hypothetical protein
MLQFNAAPVVTSNPLGVNRKPCISRNREPLGDRRDGGREARARASQQNVRPAAPCDRARRYDDRKGDPTRETHHAKVDDDDSVPDPGRHFGGDGADGWFAKSSRTSIGELGPAIATGRRTCRPPATARRSSALGEKPDGSQRSGQSRERGARPQDPGHLSGLLNAGLDVAPSGCTQASGAKCRPN